MPLAFAAAYSMPPDRATALTRPSDQAGRTATWCPRSGNPPITRAPVHPHRQRGRRPRIEGRGKRVRVERGGVDRLLEVHPEQRVVQEEPKGPLVLLVGARGAE